MCILIVVHSSPVHKKNRSVFSQISVFSKTSNGKMFIRDAKEQIMTKNNNPTWIDYCIHTINLYIEQMSFHEVNRRLFNDKIYIKYFLFQMLLLLARTIFSQQSSMDGLIKEILIVAQEMFKCEKCSFFLFDHSQEVNPHSNRIKIVFKKD